jgi:hypothetical protein
MDITQGIDLEEEDSGADEVEVGTGEVCQMDTEEEEGATTAETGVSIIIGVC